jgi:transcriptional regulator with XRE-family HTH domain
VGESQSFGVRLRSARLQAGLSQSALETRSGIPKARLSRYENGHVLPSIETLARLASALEVSEASLLGDQRAILEELFNVLFRRGVRIYTVEQATRLGNALADILELASPPAEPAEPTADVATATLAEMAGAAVAPEAGIPAEPAGAELVPPA